MDASPINTKQSASFYEQVRLALNNFLDPRWLGEHSPLAAPYFLGTALKRSSAAGTAQDRGKTLCQELQSAAATLWPGSLPADKDSLLTAVNEERLQHGNKGVMYHYLLLDLRYFRQYFYPRAHPQAKKEVDLRDYLGVGRGPYFNHLKTARQNLGDALLNRLRPSFRLEQPVQRSEALIARKDLVRGCMDDLQAGKTVAISGMGGVGKTSLGAAVAGQWPLQPTFWFTIRPTFNDQLSSLLFSLAYFLHQQGTSGLWLQLVADKGKVENYNLALAHLRGDLHTLPQAPLLCFDEIDYLQADSEKLGSDQIQVREFMESLRGLAPTLLIGQQPGLIADTHYTLPGLTLPQVATFLTEANVSFDSADVHLLHAYTSGNPRLLRLIAALAEDGRSLSEIVSETPGAPALPALLERFWGRLNIGERQTLLRLAVFRSPAPDDAWPDLQLSLKRLAEQHIAQQDGYGGVSLLPVIRDLLVNDRQRFPAELHDQCQLEAADIRAARGEYTDAAWHYSQAGEGALAIQIWFPYREQEVKRGQAAAALTIFQQMSLRRLADAEKQALALLRAELYELTAEADKGLDELKAIKWPSDSMVSADALLLRGQFLNALGRAPAALDTYEEGIAVLAHLHRQLVHFRYRRSITFVQQRQMEEAWQEARLAQYEADHLGGLVQDEQGQFDEAYSYYRRALALAKSINYEPGIAQTNRELAILLSRQAKPEEAMPHAQEAIAYYKRTGDRFGLETMHNVLTAIYFQAGQFEKSIEIAEIALSFFEEARLPYWASTTGATLAEAYFEIGDLEKAEQVARKVLKIEEPQSYPYALFALASLFTAVVQADDCLYQVSGACLETTPASDVDVLQRYFVIEHANNRQRIYDVWIKAARPDIFDQVLQTIRSQSPDLQQYNNQFLIRASGEIGIRDLQKAVNHGLIEEVSRTLIDDQPIVSVSYSPSSPTSLPAPPWDVNEIAATDVLTTYVVATPVFTTYVHLQRSKPGIVPLNPSLAEQALVPEGMLATFFMADETTMQALIDFLNLD